MMGGGHPSLMPGSPVAAELGGLAAARGLGLGSNSALGEQHCRCGSPGCQEPRLAGHLLSLFLQASLNLIYLCLSPLTEVLELSSCLLRVHGG